MLLLALACLSELPSSSTALLDDSPVPAGDSSCQELTSWLDADGDGFGDPQQELSTCEPVSGFVDNDLDCDDSDPGVFPGAEEQCDEVDQDCDGELDEDAVDTSTWYEDLDGDGYGVGEAVSGCFPPADSAPQDGDCDDGNGHIHPDALEACDAADNDCNGLIDDGEVCLCPVDWYEGHAYQFCAAYELSWESAELACTTYGYHLVTLDDGDENAYVHGVLDLIGIEGWWAGLNDIASEGDWVWVSGSSSGYRNWGSGQPNNWLWNQHCMELYSEGRDTWNDETCSDRRRFVCESP